MGETCTVQLHARGSWHDVASVTLLGQKLDGWKAGTYSGYGVEWAFEHVGAIDAHMGLEPAVHAHLLPGILARAGELEALS